MTNEFDDNENKEQEQDEFSLVKHSVKHKQTERRIRKKRRRANRLKKFLRFILIIALFFSGYWLYKLPGWYFASDMFKNPCSCKIEIVNNKIVPDFVIYNTLKDTKISKRPVFFVPVQPIRKKIFKIPVIKNVYVRRYGFPARLQIIVRERVPIAVIKHTYNERPSAFYTTDGVLVTNKQYMNLPIGNDVLTILAQTNNINKSWTMSKVRYLEKIAKSVEVYSGEKVEYVDMRNPNDVYVKIHTTSIRLGALDSTVFERIKRIYTILPQITEVDSRIKYIDLSWDKVNYLKLNKSK